MLYKLIKLRKSDIIGKYEHNPEKCRKILVIITSLFCNANFKYILTEERKNKMMALMSLGCQEDEDLSALSLFIAIDNIFGYGDYHYTKNINIDEYEEEIEDDGNKISNLRVFNTKKHSI